MFSNRKNWFEQRSDNNLRICFVGCALLFAAWALFIFSWIVLAVYYPYKNNWIVVVVSSIPMPVLARGFIDAVQELKRRKIKLRY